MISEYEDNSRLSLFDAPRLYALNQTHKHLPEMKKVTAITNSPLFMPIVSDYDCGMEVIIPIFASDLSCSLEQVKQIYKNYYGSKVVYYRDESENGFLSANLLSGRDDMQISAYGNEERIILVSRFDNLGKGASGAAIQNMNIALGLDETLGLVLGE